MKAIAYTDGSFNAKNMFYGYGVLIETENGERYFFYDSSNNSERARLRNVAGEVWGTMKAIEESILLGVDILTIYYDYEGIEKWAISRWNAYTPYTQEYCENVQEAMKKIDISWQHVKSHSGNHGNDFVDTLAKYAVGINLTNKQSIMLEEAGIQ